MSASNKKKLRNAEEAAKMTERQLAEQKEAKKLKVYSTAFIVVLAALLVVAIVIGATQFISNSGIREKNTVAMTVGNREISNADLNYFFIDSVNQFYSQNGAYASLMGLDITQPLDTQVFDPTTGDTWGDYLLDSAMNTAHTIYALADAAEAAGHTMTDSELETLDNTIANMDLYAMIYGYGDAESYLKAMYGPGATAEGYKNYVEVSLMADSYYAAYANSLTYDDAALRAAEAENFHKYSSFTYNSYYIAASRFLEGGTTDENGTTTYSEEEKAASVEAARAAADSLVSAEITTAEELDAAIAALSINKDTVAASTFCENYGYASINASIAEWLSNNTRQEGDMTVIESSYTSTADDGTETVTINGYYVVLFHSINENNVPLKNIRHILVSFEGGTTDSYGITTYSDEEKLAAEEAAHEILKEWESGEATEDSFATLATLKSTDTGSSSNGGLYENVCPGDMVPAFNNWLFDETRKTGDTGIVETEYGFHVMYFVGNSDINYRDYQISNKLKNVDLADWNASLLESQPMTEGNTSYIRTGLILSSK